MKNRSTEPVYIESLWRAAFGPPSLIDALVDLIDCIYDGQYVDDFAAFCRAEYALLGALDRCDVHGPDADRLGWYGRDASSEWLRTMTFDELADWGPGGAYVAARHWLQCDPVPIEKVDEALKQAHVFLSKSDHEALVEAGYTLRCWAPPAVEALR